MPRQEQQTLNPVCEPWTKNLPPPQDDMMNHHLGCHHPFLDQTNRWSTPSHLVCLLSNDSRSITWYLHFPAGLYDVYALLLYMHRKNGVSLPGDGMPHSQTVEGITTLTVACGP